LSLALGAFTAGMLIGETEYRYQVEEDIKPFRDVLLGLFFVAIGMRLNVPQIVGQWPLVLALLVSLLAFKLVIVGVFSRLLGSSPGTSLRSGLWLCAGGEFGFVILARARDVQLLAPETLQPVLAAMVLSLLLAPLIVHFSDRLVFRFVASEWLLRSMQLTQLAAQSLTTDKHAIICGYGRTGQHLARFLEAEGISYMALDLDPERVREASMAAEAVSYGDSSKKETLLAAGLLRASVVIVTFADSDAALRVIHRVRELRPEVAIVARAGAGRHRKTLRRRRCRGRTGGPRIQRDAGDPRAGALGHTHAQGDQAPARDARKALLVVARLLPRRHRRRRPPGGCRPAAPACGDTDAWRSGDRASGRRHRSGKSRRWRYGDPPPFAARTQAGVVAGTAGRRCGGADRDGGCGGCGREDSALTAGLKSLQR
jgi:hypothetical protein